MSNLRWGVIRCVGLGSDGLSSRDNTTKTAKDRFEIHAFRMS